MYKVSLCIAFRHLDVISDIVKAQEHLKKKRSDSVKRRETLNKHTIQLVIGHKPGALNSFAVDACL